MRSIGDAGGLAGGAIAYCESIPGSKSSCICYLLMITFHNLKNFLRNAGQAIYIFKSITLFCGAR